MFEMLCAYAEAAAPDDFIDEAGREACASCPEYGDVLAARRRENVLRRIKERSSAVAFVAAARQKEYWLLLGGGERVRVLVLNRVGRHIVVEVLDVPRDDKGREVRSITSSVWKKRIGDEALARVDQLQALEAHPFVGPTDPKPPVYVPGHGLRREGGSLGD